MLDLVSTKVEIRFAIDDADWLSTAVKKRMMQVERTRINKRGEFSITSDKTRQAVS